MGLVMHPTIVLLSLMCQLSQFPPRKNCCFWAGAAVKEGGAGVKKAASSNLSLNNSAACRRNSSYFFQAHFFPVSNCWTLALRLWDAGWQSLTGRQAVSLSSTGNAPPFPFPARPTLNKCFKWQTAPNIFGLSSYRSPPLPLSAPSQSLSITEEKENSCRSNGRSFLLSARLLHWWAASSPGGWVGVRPCPGPPNSPTGLPSNGERYLERRRFRGREESAAAALPSSSLLSLPLLPPPLLPPSESSLLLRQWSPRQ